MYFLNLRLVKKFFFNFRLFVNLQPCFALNIFFSRMFVYLQYLSLKYLLLYIIYRFCYNCCFYKNNFGFKEYVNSNCLNLFFRYFVNICLVNIFFLYTRVSQSEPNGPLWGHDRYSGGHEQQRGQGEGHVQ